MTRVTRLVVCLAVILMAVAHIPVVGAQDEGGSTLIATGRVAFGMTDGEYVIWQEFDPDWQVPPTLYGARLDDREPFVIGRPHWESGYRGHVSVSAGVAIWVEAEGEGEQRVMMLRGMMLATREAFDIAEVDDFGHIALEGGIVVWTEATQPHESSQRIRGRDLGPGIDLDIADLPGNAYVQELFISGSRVAWQQTFVSDEVHLIVRDVTTMEPAETVTTIRLANYGPGTRGVELMAVQGQRLYWQEGFDTYSDPYKNHTRVMTQRIGESAPVEVAAGEQVWFAAAAGEQVFIQKGIRILSVDLARDERWEIGHGTGVVTDGNYAFWHTVGMFGVGESPQLVGADLVFRSVHAFDIDGVARHVAGGVVVWTEGVGLERELHAARAEDMLPDDPMPQGPATTQRPTWSPSALNTGSWNAASTKYTVSGSVGMFDVDLPWVVWALDDIHALNLVTGEAISFDTENPGWYVVVSDGMALWNAYDSNAINVRNLWTGEAFTIEVAPSDSWSPPKVSSDWAVWVEFPPYSPENPNAPGVMHAQGLWPGSEPFVVTQGASWVSDLSGDLVAFVGPAESNPGYTRVVVHNLATGETVYAHETALYVYPLDIDGSTLVYSEFASCAESMIGGCAEPHTISVVDLDRGETRTLRSHINTHEGGYPIVTDGRFILFQSSGGLGYDLELDAWFPAPSDAHSVKLDDGMLVWTTRADWEHGPTEIHMAPAEEFSSGQHARYIENASHWIAFDMLAFWDAHGGQETFGAPLTEARNTNDALDRQHSYTAQWFEYGRVELHPENAGTVYEVQLGRLGAELLDSQGRHWLSFPKASPDAAHYVPQTGHAIAPEFWEYWSSHGLEFGAPGVTWDESVALFGYPISEPMVETNAAGQEVLTQYFERAVFEWHPDNDPGSQVVLRKVGLETLLGERQAGQ